MHATSGAPSQSGTRAREVPVSHAIAPMRSTGGRDVVTCDRAFEVAKLLARNEAYSLERGEVLFRFDGFAKHQKEFAEMFVRAAVAGIEHQRLLIMPHGRPQLAQPPIGIADIVLDVGIAGSRKPRA